jgi:centromeric protein E
LKGINQTVFAYGQTSSGKTFTMKGYDTDLRLNQISGLIPLSVNEIFTTLKNNKSFQSNQISISVSYLEIYNESINDLIDPSNKNLEVRESITNGIYINRLSEKQVGSFEEVMAIMNKGDEFRNIAATKLNELSSRSHTVFRINIKQEIIDQLHGNKIKISQLNLVDLAGSEGASKTQA